MAPLVTRGPGHCPAEQISDDYQNNRYNQSSAEDDDNVSDKNVSDENSSDNTEDDALVDEVWKDLLDSIDYGTPIFDDDTNEYTDSDSSINSDSQGFSETDGNSKSLTAETNQCILIQLICDVVLAQDEDFQETCQQYIPTVQKNNIEQNVKSRLHNAYGNYTDSMFNCSSKSTFKDVPLPAPNATFDNDKHEKIIIHRCVQCYRDVLMLFDNFHTEKSTRKKPNRNKRLEF